MSGTRVIGGTVERIQTWPLKGGDLALLTGLADVLLAIQRVSDSFWLDFNDSTFKAAGWTTRQQAMTEVSATLAPGEYYYDWTVPVGDETYMIQVTQTAGTAKNVPMVGEIKADLWVQDLFDEHGDTQADVAALNDLSQADVQTAMTAQGYTSGRAPNLDNLNATVSSRSTLAQADILSDATPFAGGNINATIASRSSHSAADVDTALSGTHGAGSWATATGFSTHTAADVDTVLTGTHGAGAWTTATGFTVPADLAGLATLAGQAAIILQGDTFWATATGFSTHTAADVDTVLTGSHGAGNWITATGFSTHSAADVDTQLSGTHGASSWLSATGFAVPGDAMTLTAAERTAIDAVLAAAHGSGSWEGASAQDWNASERSQIRDALGVDGAKAAATGGDLQEVRDDVAELNDTKLTMNRANNLDEITDARLAELDAANLPADVDTLLARITAVRAANLDNLDQSIATTETNIIAALAGAGLTAPQAAQLLDVWRRLNLDPSNDVVHTDVSDSSPGRIRVGAVPVIDITLTKSGSQVTTTRTT